MGKRRRVVVISGLVAVVAWAWFASGVRTFTRPAQVLTFLPGLAVMVLTLSPSAQAAGGGGSSRPALHRRWGVLPWILVLLAILGWELAELFSMPRHLHPTISSVMDAILSTHASRFLGYLVWLLLGWLLVRDLGPDRGRPSDRHP